MMRSLRSVALIAIVPPLVLMIARLAGIHHIAVAAAIAMIAIAPGLALAGATAPEQRVYVDALALLRTIVGGVAIVTLALVAAMLVHGTIITVIGIAEVCTLSALGVMLFRKTGFVVRRPDFATGAGAILVGTTAALAGWGWRFSPLDDDGFHLARIRLVGLREPLSWLGLTELIGGSDHPGYAIPGWHALVAGAAVLADTDPIRVLPVVAILAAAGAAVAVWAIAGTVHRDLRLPATTIAVLLNFWATSRWSGLDMPGAAAMQLLAPAGLVLIIAVHRRRARRELMFIALAAVAITGTHVTYIVPLGIAAIGIALAVWLAGSPLRTTAITLGTTLAALLLPLMLYAISTLDLVLDARGAGVRRAGSEVGTRFTNVLSIGPLYVFSPTAFVAAGGIAALGVACAVIGWRQAHLRSDGVLGAGAGIMALAFVPPVFSGLALLVTISQAQRTLAMLPAAALIAVAIGGVASLRGRALLVGNGIVLIAVLLALAYAHGVIDARVVVVAGIALAAAAAFIGREARAPLQPRLMLLPAGLFVLAILLSGSAQTPRPARGAPLPDGLVAALRTLPPHTGVAARLTVAYRITSSAPVAVLASMPTHVANTHANRPYERERINRVIMSAATPNPQRRVLARAMGVREIVALGPASSPLMRAIARWPVYASGPGWRIITVP